MFAMWTAPDDQASPTLLVCDDSLDERIALAHFLRRGGFDVLEAGDGADAIHVLKNQSVDLVLLDLHMPDAGVDGFGVLGYLQEHRRALPVILLTGLDPGGLQSEMRHQHIRELPLLLMKPFDPDQLLALIDAQLVGAIDATELPSPTDTPTTPPSA
jgi:two-component system response regulator ResD